jgi:hypothetical protein
VLDFRWIGTSLHHPFLEQVPDKDRKKRNVADHAQYHKATPVEDTKGHRMRRAAERAADLVKLAAYKAIRSDVNRRHRAKSEREGKKQAAADRKNQARQEQGARDMAEARRRGIRKKDVTAERVSLKFHSFRLSLCACVRLSTVEDAGLHIAFGQG